MIAKSYTLPGLCYTSHYFEVPLDYNKPNDKKLTIFGRELVSPENAAKPDFPWLLYLEGGPGFQSPRPENNSGWIKRVLKEYRILLLDQRGTGLSSPVTHQTLAALRDANNQAEYLRHFRADNIVRDSEFIRKKLTGGKPWTVLGQSYGGFCLTTYLSKFPEGLAGAIFTGGLAPLVENPDEVYRATYPRVINNNKCFYERYPDDREAVRRIVDRLANTSVSLTTGEMLTPHRFLQGGMGFGYTIGGFNYMHYLIEQAFVPGESTDELSYVFLRAVENFGGFNTNPIYALLHESIYCQKQASHWSAERLLKEFPQFQPDHDPVYFMGEMVYSWMFDEYECLKPLKTTAQLLANYSDWPELYDVNTLRKNHVPSVAAVYYNDMYVDRALQEHTASNIRDIKLWITNEYEHNGIREDGEVILDRLLRMLKNEF